MTNFSWELKQEKVLNNGKVYLVGAGPGAADLLTLRAARVLEQAEVLLYDRLVSEEILDMVGKGARRVYVGKELAANSQLRQERIYALMIGHAREGRRVVRLKGGDPYVFGRGSEEMLELVAAGIEAEVVPGISSCISAPGQAHIPVTHRGLAASFGVFTGHPGDGVRAVAVDWIAAARIGTAVFLMGVSKLPEIVERLGTHGRSADTPVALIEQATRPGQKVVTGTLADILSKSHSVRSPTTIVVGEVVGVGTHIAEMKNAQAAALFENVS